MAKIYYESDELYHYGVLGMKWGVRRDRSKPGYFKRKKLKKQRLNNLEKARQARVAKREHEAAKQKALKIGNATEVLKYKNELTYKELTDAYNRINVETNLKNISAKEIASGKSRVDRMLDTAVKVQDIVDKGTKAYNTIAKINNSLNDDKLPILDGTTMKEKKAKAKKEKLINSGTPEEVVKNFGKLTVKELEDINKRMNYEENIRKRMASK